MGLEDRRLLRVCYWSYGRYGASLNHVEDNMSECCSRNLITVNGGVIRIDASGSILKEFWHCPESYAESILARINSGYYGNLLRIAHDGMKVVDLGAHIGLFSLYVSDLAKVVVAVEPTPNHFTILNKMMADYDNIITINGAAFCENSDIQFYINSNNTSANSFIPYNGSDKAITVSGMTIKTLVESVKLDHIDLCKVSIAGSEEIAICDNVIQDVKGMVDSWMLEVHPNRIGGYDANINHFMSLFNRHGYLVDQVAYDLVMAVKPNINRRFYRYH